MHLHTVSSDGHLTLDELVQKYWEEKFDFISITDHWCFPQLNGNRQTLPLLVIDGVELDGYDNLRTHYHVLAIGASLKPPLLTGNFLKTLRSAYSQGAILIWAHPYWTGNSIREGLRHKFHGFDCHETQSPQVFPKTHIQPRDSFVERLGRVVSKTGTGCFAWARMPYHAHVLLHTGRTPIAVVMRRVLTG